MSELVDNELALFQAIEDNFNLAMVSNDIDRIAECITEEGTGPARKGIDQSGRNPERDPKRLAYP